MPRQKIPLTVIVPVYQRQGKLERALASILDQDVAPTEVIVVDDASPTPTAIPPGRSDLPIRLIRHETNRGAAAARSTGLAAAATDYIAFLDSDDALLPNTLGARWADVEHRLGQGGADAVIFGCGWWDVSEDGARLRQRIPRPGRTPADFAAGCWFSPGSCTILNGRAALAAAGPQDAALRRFEDYDWFLSLALAGFTLEVTPLAGATIERRRQLDTDLVARGADAVRRKWRGELPPQLARRLESYMDLEEASALHYAGRRLLGMAMLARSLARVPRTRIELSPGWTA